VGWGNNATIGELDNNKAGLTAIFTTRSLDLGMRLVVWELSH
jgi:hypothetical protein